jgi:hypothetical protein
MNLSKTQWFFAIVITIVLSIGTGGYFLAIPAVIFGGYYGFKLISFLLKATGRGVVGATTATGRGAKTATVMAGKGVIIASWWSLKKSYEAIARIFERRRNKLDWEENLRRKKIEADIQSEIDSKKEVLKSEGLLKLYEKQLAILVDAKKQGLAIEADLFDMRKKLLALEKEENSAMLQELMQTLEAI